MNKVLYVDTDVFFENDIEIYVPLESSVEIEVENGVTGDRFPYYTGEYNITPSIEEKVLETKNKSMSNDLTISKIPKYEFSNVANGQTVVIGGNL